MRKLCGLAISAVLLGAGPALAQENPTQQLDQSFADLVDDGWDAVTDLGTTLVLLTDGDDYAVCNLGGFTFDPDATAFETLCFQITE